MRILGREPAFFVGLVAVVVQFAVAWGLDLTHDQQAGINAVTTLLMGLIVALSVSRDQVLAVAAALVTAVLQLGVSFGAHLSQDRITMTVALFTAVLAGFLRTQLTAPVAADGSKVPRQTISGAA